MNIVGTKKQVSNLDSNTKPIIPQEIEIGKPIQTILPISPRLTPRRSLDSPKSLPANAALSIKSPWVKSILMILIFGLPLLVIGYFSLCAINKDIFEIPLFAGKNAIVSNTTIPSQMPSAPPTSLQTWLSESYPSIQPSTNLPSEHPTSFDTTHSKQNIYIRIEPSPLPSTYQTTSPNELSIPPTKPTTLSPTNLLTMTPTVYPSPKPTEKPTFRPSPTPTMFPSPIPTPSPTANPTFLLSQTPSEHPSFIPSDAPSEHPSFLLSDDPSENPTFSPSSAPSFSSHPPTLIKTLNPSASPSIKLTTHPSTQPSNTLTNGPSEHATPAPTVSPSHIPTKLPSLVPSTSTPTAQPTERREIVFYVMGDIPYSVDEEKELSRQLTEIPTDARFVYHVGDINRAWDTGCTEQVYANVKRLFLKSSHPVFVTPGDNDFNDCPNPERAMMYWDKHLTNIDKFWNHSLNVDRQRGRNENVAFYLNDSTLFLGVNLVGGEVHSKDEWKKRLSDNYRWASYNVERYWDVVRAVVIFGHASPRSVHDDFFNPLAELLEELGKPVLYIHGDGHKYKLRERLFGVRNMIEVQVDMGRRNKPLKITIKEDYDDEEIFQIERKY